VNTELPYLTDDAKPLGGRIKAKPEDFFVEEFPLYPASGEGTHVYLTIEKTGLSTMRAVREIAKALGIPHRHVGYAGLKDADAVTRQTISIEHIDPERVRALAIPRIRVIAVTRHTNKLKLGHLRGNRFVIRVREAVPDRLVDVRAVLDRLVREGVPNYFGAQRFGLRGDTWMVGRAMILDDLEQAVDLLLGRPNEADYGEVRKARELYDDGRYEEAARTWPYPFRDERRACQMMATTGGKHRRAFVGFDKSLKRLYISAFQSYLFNQVVAARIGGLGRLMTGDLAYRHGNGAVFTVEDAALEQPRADAFEISPSGPLFGYRMTEPTGEPAAIEAAILSREGIRSENFRAPGAHKVKGQRRPLRFQPTDASVATGCDERGAYYEFRFFLPPGCYATMVLREICKTETLVHEVAE
jgi:tRNA pseudouridine13 synthase